MAKGRFRVVVNGFSVNTETKDDLLQLDGKRDEVTINVSVKDVDKAGQIVFNSMPGSPVLGDTNRLPGRVLAGTASRLGGLRTGDVFPGAPPYLRSQPLNPARNYPPFSVW